MYAYTNSNILSILQSCIMKTLISSDADTPCNQPQNGLHVSNTKFPYPLSWYWPNGTLLLQIFSCSYSIVYIIINNV